VPLDVPALRARSAARAAVRPRGPEPAAIAELIVPDTPGVKARHYHAGADDAALLVYLHGGMWVLGSLTSHDALCRRLCVEAGIDVLAVDYRLAPEHPYPAAVDDARAAILWAAAELMAPRLAVGGDSAGGTIALLAALGVPAGTLSALVLLCPNTDLTGAHLPATVDADGDLDPASVLAAARLWAPTALEAASPLLAPDLSGLPRTLLLTAGPDPLRPEGDALAARLAAAGVPVSHRTEPDAPHGFVMDAGDATDRALADVRALLG
jgi:acetyl esterase